MAEQCLDFAEVNQEDHLHMRGGPKDVLSMYHHQQTTVPTLGNDLSLYNPYLSEPAVSTFTLADLCRVCATKQDNMVAIFGNEGTTMQLQNKLNLCLPIKVKETDLLPTCVCRHCVSRVLQSHELFTICHNADVLMLRMLHQQNVSSYEGCKMEPNEGCPEMMDVTPDIIEEDTSGDVAYLPSTSQVDQYNMYHQGEDPLKDADKSLPREEGTVVAMETDKQTDDLICPNVVPGEKEKRNSNLTQNTRITERQTQTTINNIILSSDIYPPENPITGDTVQSPRKGSNVTNKNKNSQRIIKNASEKLQNLEIVGLNTQLSSERPIVEQNASFSLSGQNTTSVRNKGQTPDLSSERPVVEQNSCVGNQQTAASVLNKSTVQDKSNFNTEQTSTSSKTKNIEVSTRTLRPRTQNKISNLLLDPPRTNLKNKNPRTNLKNKNVAPFEMKTLLFVGQKKPPRAPPQEDYEEIDVSDLHTEIDIKDDPDDFDSSQLICENTLSMSALNPLIIPSTPVNPVTQTTSINPQSISSLSPQIIPTIRKNPLILTTSINPQLASSQIIPSISHNLVTQTASTNLQIIPTIPERSVTQATSINPQSSQIIPSIPHKPVTQTTSKNPQLASSHSSQIILAIPKNPESSNKQLECTKIQILVKDGSQDFMVNQVTQLLQNNRAVKLNNVKISSSSTLGPPKKSMSVPSILKRRSPEVTPDLTNDVTISSRRPRKILPLTLEPPKSTSVPSILNEESPEVITPSSSEQDEIKIGENCSQFVGKLKEKLSTFIEKQNNSCDDVVFNKNATLKSYSKLNPQIEFLNNKPVPSNITQQTTITTQNVTRFQSGNNLFEDFNGKNNIPHKHVSIKNSTVSDIIDLPEKCLNREDLKFKFDEKVCEFINHNEIKCTICGRYFHKYNLKMHKLTHHRFRPHPLVIHKQQEQQIKKIIEPKERVCPICGILHSNMSVHLRSHQEKNIVCEICKHRFYNEAALNNHRRRTHETERNVQCKFCPKKFKSSHDIDCHIKKVHSKEWSYHCKECNEIFKNESEIEQHITLHFPNKKLKNFKKLMERKSPYFCEMCNKYYSCKHTMKMHLKNLHSHERILLEEKRKVVCDFCGITYRFKSTMKCHLAKHLGVREHVCKKCGRSYDTVCAFKRHKLKCRKKK